ncbi:hypothetical protein KEJ47_09375 [Candidatus Bathyarchaeota archaeon]|nr:hypothetical protein [Candidatus Bathyarchaeota archaeon]
MASAENASHGDLDSRVNMLFDVLDADPYFSMFDEKDQASIEQELVSELMDSESFVSKLCRAEFLKKPIVKIANYEFEPVEILPDECLQIRTALREEMRSIDAENFSLEEELIERTAFRMIGRPYMEPGEEREELFLNDEKLYAAFADAWQKAEAVYNRSLRGALPELPDYEHRLFFSTKESPGIEVPVEVPEVPEAPKKAPIKKKTDSIRRHWKKIVGGTTAGMLIVTAGAVYANNLYSNQPRIDQLKARGGTDDTARGFNSQYGARLTSINNQFNNSVLRLYDIYVNNATLAQVVESGARTTDGDLWGTVEYVADNLQTPQYLPKTEMEAKMMSKLVRGVDSITSYPKVLYAYAVDSIAFVQKLSYGNSSNEARILNGMTNVANYMVGLIRNGNITIVNLDGKDLQILLAPYSLAGMSIREGTQSEYSVDTFEKNTTPDSSDGMTPLEWQGRMLYKIKAEKGELYKAALKDGSETLAHAWPDAEQAFRAGIANLPDKDDILFVYAIGGLSRRLPINGSLENWTKEIVDVKGAHQPYYAAIVGMHFGKPVKVHDANYPGDLTTYHTDHSIWGSDGKYHGPFMYPEEMAKAYSDPTKMKLEELLVW